MRYFLYKLILFFIPFAIIPIFEAFIIPTNFFTFRSWEALSFSNKACRRLAQAPFYPNCTLRMKEQGDLVPYTNKSIVKNTVWITDQLGYRNDKFVSDPDILLFGDSFFVGNGLSQSETITNTLSSKLYNKAKVYNFASGSLRQFDVLYRNGLLKKPKLIIFESVERNNISFPTFFKTGEILEKKYILSFYIPAFIKDIIVKFDRMLRLYSVNWMQSRFHPLFGRSALSNPVELESKMIFLQGKSVTVHSDKELKESFNAIMSYKKYCDSIGVNFLFVSMPNKETVYFDFVPLDTQPDYLFKLDSLLNKNGVATINVLSIYNAERQKKNILLYHYDDTHWNSTATELIANEIINQEHLIE